jgi:polyphenol oxidase
VSAIESGEFEGAARLVSWAATGRAGGASAGSFESLNLAEYVGDEVQAVAENRRRLAGLVGLGTEDLAVMGAVHGAEVALVADAGPVEGVDALVTTSSGVALLALAADCVPLVIADSVAGVIAAVHCGWRGLGAGVVAATVSMMRGLGATRLEAVVGPAICAACYPVPADRVQSLRRSLDGDVSDVACIDRGGPTGCPWHRCAPRAHLHPRVASSLLVPARHRYRQAGHYHQAVSVAWCPRRRA